MMKFTSERVHARTTARLLAGIHFRSDIVTGLQLGHRVAALVNAWADQDGSRTAMSPESH